MEKIENAGAWFKIYKCEGMEYNYFEFDKTFPIYNAYA